ncbi:(d)CMP kinase [Eubacteriales bacterium OttesenSCG-928-K08]|nr:(d)CMP kinase [Eubacteriales bacterium OttesenSCG-928-K08]
MHLHVAIDGPAGAGKSTIAKAVARKLNIPYLDTGAMFRTLAFYAFESGIDPNDESGVERALPNAKIKITYDEGVQRMWLNGRDITSDIRTPKIGRGASDISRHPAVRAKLLEMQRQVAKDGSVVMDGRDICTVVMPDAPFAFYVTASVSERAKRRIKEFEQKGETAPTIEQMEQMISERDYQDMNREFAPLKVAERAIVVDTTELTIDESIAAVLRAVTGEGE